jgi:hypothetical protein
MCSPCTAWELQTKLAEGKVIPQVLLEIEISNNPHIDRIILSIDRS